MKSLKIMALSLALTGLLFLSRTSSNGPLVLSPSKAFSVPETIPPGGDGGSGGDGGP